MVLPSDQDASGRSFGDDELAALRDVLESGTLTATKGRQTPALEAAFGELTGATYVLACASGTAAVHAAVAALDPEPGEEIVTTPITDMGAIAPILQQGAIPVFADVDPVSGMPTAATIADRLSDRTRAVVVTHLFGRPAELGAIVELADRHGIPVIEDCAQAYLAEHAGRPVGRHGAIGCFSLQQGKHVTSGEGGLVITEDPALARRARMFVNKAWPYGEPDPDHEFLAPNYRISELQAAVARIQLGRLGAKVALRIANAERLTAALAGTPGLVTPAPDPGDVHTYWRYPVLVTDDVPGGPDAVAARLGELGVPAAPRYIKKPAFQCAVIRDQRTFGSSRWPFTLARPEALHHHDELFPGVHRYLSQVLVLPWNEGFRDEHVDTIADALRDALRTALEAS